MTFLGKNVKVNKANVIDWTADKHHQRSYNDALPKKKEEHLLVGIKITIICTY